MKETSIKCYELNNFDKFILLDMINYKIDEIRQEFENAKNEKRKNKLENYYKYLIRCYLKLEDDVIDLDDVKILYKLCIERYNYYNDCLNHSSEDKSFYISLCSDFLKYKSMFERVYMNNYNERFIFEFIKK